MSDVFIVGAPRSGTSWLRTLLAGHSDLASPYELHIFNRYLAPADAAWRKEQAELVERRRLGRNDAVGLASLLAEEEMHGWICDLYRRAREAAIERKPGAKRMLEKTPGHAMHLDLIRRIVPNARFIHIVRDPREVVASMLERSRRPFGEWAPKSVPRATSSWRKHVRAALRDGRDDDTLQVRYDHLRADPLTTLSVIGDFLALEGAVEDWVVGDPAAPAFVRAGAVTVGRGSARAPSSASSREDEGEDHGAALAQRIGAPTQVGLHRSARWYVEAVCAEEMEALGFSTPGPSGDPLRLARGLIGRTVVHGNAALARLGQRTPRSAR